MTQKLSGPRSLPLGSACLVGPLQSGLVGNGGQ